MQQYITFFRRGGLLAALLFLVLTSPPARAQAPAWRMAVAAGSSNASINTSRVLATAPDARGNVYLAGRFSGTVSFGSTSLTSIRLDDAFVAKWNSASSSFEWAIRAGGTDDDVINGIAVSGSSVYVTGTFLGNSIRFGTMVLSNAGVQTEDIFVARLTDSATGPAWDWAQRVGGAGQDYGSSIAVRAGAVYVGGSFANTVAFGTTTLVSAGQSDIFVARLTDLVSGPVWSWAYRGGGPGYEATTALTVNGSNLYMAGVFEGTANFNGMIMTSAGITDAFIIKLVDIGPGATWTWGARMGGSGNEGASALAVNGSNLYLSGSFASSTASFGTTVLTNSGSGYPDGFVTKLTDNGGTVSFGWAQRAGGGGEDYCMSVAAAGPNVYLTGFFTSSTIRFGTISLANINGMFGGGNNLFLAKLTDAGSSSSYAWALVAGSTIGDQRAAALALSGSSVYVAGEMQPSLRLGSISVVSDSGSPMAFLASLTDPLLSATAPGLDQAAIRLHPNPAHGTATIQLPAMPGAGSATLTLTDALGRAVRTHTLALPAAGLRHELSLAGLAPGLYSLRVQAGEASAVRRLVVE
jgi:hypothetical protein